MLLYDQLRIFIIYKKEDFKCELTLDVVVSNKFLKALFDILKLWVPLGQELNPHLLVTLPPKHKSTICIPRKQIPVPFT